MGFKKWVTVLVVLLFIATHFFPWLYIESRQITVSALDATGTRFGKPGLVSLLLSGLYLVFALISKGWARWVTIIFGALNMGWVIRNFTLLSMCYGGECPQKQSLFYVYLAAGVTMLLLALLQPVPVAPAENETAPT